MLKSGLLGPTDPAANYLAPSASGERELDLGMVIAFLRRRWMFLAAGFGLAVMLAVVYVVVTPPLYTAKSMLMLDTRRLQLFEQQSVMTQSALDEPAVQSQIEVIKSENVASSVIHDLKLDKDPEFTGNVHSFFGSLISSILHWGALDTGEVESQEKMTRAALKHFQGNLSVAEVGHTYIIEIGFRALDRGKAAWIANAAADAYILDQIQAKYQTTKRASAWLKDRLAELREQAVAADRDVQDFREKNKIVDTSNGRLVNDQQVSEFSTQLVLANAQAAEYKAQFDRIREIQQAGWKHAAETRYLRSDVIDRLQQQYKDLATQAAEYAARPDKDESAISSVRQQMSKTEQAVTSELQRLAETYRSNYETANTRQQVLQGTVDQLTKQSTETRQAQGTSRMLEASAQAYRKLYDSFLQRFVETTQQMSFPNSEARVITAASEAEKTYPKTSLVLGLAAMLGLLLGGGIAYALERFDRGFRTPQQVEQIVGAECLGILPEIREQDPAGPVVEETAQAAEGSAGRAIHRDLGLARHVIKAPFSRFTETIRSIKVTADMTTPRARVVGIVSALPGEGKSTVSANFAQLAAHTGSHTLLIDADLRMSSLSRWMAGATEQGLLGVLDGHIALADAVWRDPLTGLDFLPAGGKSSTAHSSEIVASPAMERLLTAAREQYDYIIVDFPPLAPVIDAKAAGHLVDAFVLVIRWGETSLDILAETLGNAEIIHEKLLGAVLNRADMTALKRLEAYKGRSYHSYYSSYISAD